MKRDILTIRNGECRFPTTDAPPHFFCGEPVAELRDDTHSMYCPAHHLRCYDGFGLNVRALEAMIYRMDDSFQVTSQRSQNIAECTVPVDKVISDDK